MADVDESTDSTNPRQASFPEAEDKKGGAVQPLGSTEAIDLAFDADSTTITEDKGNQEESHNSEAKVQSKEAPSLHDQKPEENLVAQETIQRPGSVPYTPAMTPLDHLKQQHNKFLEEQREREKAHERQMRKDGYPAPVLVANSKKTAVLPLASPVIYQNPLAPPRTFQRQLPSFIRAQRGAGASASYSQSTSYQSSVVVERSNQESHQSIMHYEAPPSIIFSIAADREFCAKLKGSIPEGVISSFRLTPGARYRKNRRRWYFPLTAYSILSVAMERFRKKHYHQTGIIIGITYIPNEVLEQLTVRLTANEVSDTQKEAHALLTGRIPDKLLESLAPFQREGVAFILGRKGRGLIADEMGLGKTIQAVAVASAYQDEWPLLIMCPSSARFHWESELLKWLDRDLLPASSIQVVTSGNASIPHSTRVVIVSYDLAVRLKEDYLKPVFSREQGALEVRYKVVIADECHYLKNSNAIRTRELLPLLADAKRAILLSGTPALSRPRELWTQLNVLNARAWKDQASFLDRYCTGGRSVGTKRKWKGRGQGAANLRELHEMLKATVMIRRRKKDILKALPPKRRSFHHVDVPEEEIRSRLTEALLELKIADARTKERRKKKKKRQSVVYDDGKTSLENLADTSAEDLTARELQTRRKLLLMEVFKLTGTAKAPVAIARVQELLASDLGGKMLVFAHHRNVLDAIEEGALKDVLHIRIDGSTPPKERHNQVNRFQSDPNIRVALLSLTAAGLSLTLTAANRALFVELFWTPAVLLQAEDRCHRIGQTSEVKIEYLLANGSLDDCLWPMIRRKMRVLGELVEGMQDIDMIDDKYENSQGDDKISSKKKMTALSDKEGYAEDLAKTDGKVLHQLALEDRDRGQGDEDEQEEEDGEEKEEHEEEDSSDYGWESTDEDDISSSSDGDGDDEEIHELFTVEDEDDGNNQNLKCETSIPSLNPGIKTEAKDIAKGEVVVID